MESLKIHKKNEAKRIMELSTMDIIQILHGVLMGGIRNNKARQARLSDKERGN